MDILGVFTGNATKPDVRQRLIASRITVDRIVVSCLPAPPTEGHTLHLIKTLVLSLVLTAGCSRSSDVSREPEPPNFEEKTRTMGTKPPEHAVLIQLRLSDHKFGTSEERESIHALSDELEAVIQAQRQGEFDGDEFGGGICTLYMYGPDADSLFTAIEPLLRKSPLTKGASVIKRYGAAADPNSKQVRLAL
jgi:hypothetical protein